MNKFRIILYRSEMCSLSLREERKLYIPKQNSQENIGKWRIMENS
jgi:hypothetical protein